MFQRDAPHLGSLLALSTILDVLSPNSAHFSSQHSYPQPSRLYISPAMCIRVPAQVPVFPSSPCLAQSHTPSTPSYNSHLYSCPCYHKYAAPHTLPRPLALSCTPTLPHSGMIATAPAHTHQPACLIVVQLHQCTDVSTSPLVLCIHKES